MSIRTILLVRHNVDWAHMTDAHFYSQGKTADHPRLPVGLGILQQCRLPEVWRDLFGVEYFWFRHQMKRIAQFFNGNVQDAVHVLGYEQLRPYMESDEDFFIAPSDDDDCFHPHLAKDISLWHDKYPATRIVCWPQTTIHHSDFYRLNRGTQAWYRTNCYALRKSYLLENFDMHYVLSFLWNHASGQAFTRKTNDNVYWGKRLSLTHKHLGSAGGLVHLTNCREINEHGRMSPCEQCFRRGLIDGYDRAVKPISRKNMPEWVKRIVPHIRSVYAQFTDPR